jgi:UDPglucose 6-dehydrogenase
VTVVDKDAARIRKWNSQHPPIHEPGLNEIVRVARDGTNAATIAIEGGDTVELPARQSNLFFSTDVARCVSEADIVFLSVNTPTKYTGIGAGAATNMVALEGATRDIAIAAKPGAIIVEKSTVPCRTAQIVRDTVRRRLILLFHVLYAFSAGTIGVPVHDCVASRSCITC